MTLVGPRLSPASGGKARSLIVPLHGYGSNGDDMISLAETVRPLLPNTVFVAPNAPSVLPAMAQAHQWWPIRSFSAAERLAGAKTAAPAINAFLDEELVRFGLAADRLLLIGFSQGTMMALHVALRRERPIAGIIGYSGMLVGPETMSAGVRSRPPVMLVLGKDDDVVPFTSLEASRSALEAIGVPVETHVSMGLGHGIGPDGVAAGVTFAKRVLGETS